MSNYQSYYAVKAFFLDTVAEFTYLSDAQEFAKARSATIGASSQGVEYNVIQIRTDDEDELTMLDNGVVNVFFKGDCIFSCYMHNNDADAAAQAWATRYTTWEEGQAA